MTPREPITHDLKTWPEPFCAVWSGDKTFEIRRSDRDYRVGDTLLLREWCIATDSVDCAGGDHFSGGHYTGREITTKVLYMIPGGKWGLPADLCVMSIAMMWRDTPLSKSAAVRTTPEARQCDEAENARRSSLPSSDRDHVCGLVCDGQDGMNSECATLRRSLGYGGHR